MMHSLWLLAAAWFATMVSMPEGTAQEVNYDERRVPEYTLPDPLVGNDGTRIVSAAEWRNKRRGEVLELFTREMFGRQPPTPLVLVNDSAEIGSAFAGAARRKLVTLEFARSTEAGAPRIALHLLIYLPQASTKGQRVPVFVALNFQGNQAISDDPDVPITTSWVPNDERQGISDHQANESNRGKDQARWPLSDILARGYGLVTLHYGDIDPDDDDGFRNGVHAMYPEDARTDESWGSIAAWSWGLSRIMDYCERDTDMDADRVAVMGHSRLGKTALWAGACDERIALVISNNSGCGGAALSRRQFGETVERINTAFPHWFCGNFKKYNEKEADLPFDQHMLVALVAPRPVLICSAEEDAWADPRGEFLAARGADDVYRLLGTDGIATQEMPAVNVPILSRIGYHIRPGKHDVTRQDWKIYMDFADKHWVRQ